MLKAADPQERIAVTVLLRRRTTNRELPALLEALSAQSLRTRHYMSREQFALAHGADPDDIDRIEAFAHEYDLDVVEVYAAQRRVVLSGAIMAISAAFGVSPAQYTYPGRNVSRAP
jgi:kumamolisin